MFNLAWINSAIKLTQLREFVGEACSKMLSLEIRIDGNGVNQEFRPIPYGSSR
jgi:hypothetical protein